MTNLQDPQDAQDMPNISDDANSPEPPPGCSAHAGAAPLYGPRFQDDPSGVYQQMRREHGSVAPILLEGDLPAWLVLGYRDVLRVTTDVQTFERDSRRWSCWPQVPADWNLLPWVAPGPVVLHTEGEEHRMRSMAISQAIAAIDPFELQSYCERFADDMVDTFAGRGNSNLINEYVYAVPSLVMARLFGIPNDELETVAKAVCATVIADDDAIPGQQRAAELLARLVAARRQAPGSDIISQLLQAAPTLSDEQAVADLMAMMAGQLPLTACWIGNTIRLMLMDDRFSLTLSGGRLSVGEALTEVLWADSPMQNLLGRYVTRDTTLGGQHLRAGDLVVLGYAAANRDPLLWSDSDAGFAGNSAHLSFSHGDYGCPVGAPEMAKTIAQTTVAVLLDRLPDVTLAVAPDELEWLDSLWYRGLASLPVTFTPAPAGQPR
ncbi:cytochrome P450 [Streptomyces sp. 110]|uniref:Cytochrome P450 n=1 Tax=Streptomyces endocoffeicus TaxID=2898945 RepID=A0ABS1Q5U1_9ACTN|nr:cytochrome P450 [Streptomyces endocoffeicus]MBL1120048.1 cytochrome P450 [Streptomyces endocoffeicus]